MNSSPVPQKSRWTGLEHRQEVSEAEPPKPQSKPGLGRVQSDASDAVIGTVCGRRCCHHSVVDVAATSKMHSPLSLLLCVSCFRVKDPGGQPAEPRPPRLSPCLAAGGAGAAAWPVASVWEMRPTFHRDACSARLSRHVKGVQVLGSLNTATVHPPPGFHTRIKNPGPSQACSRCIPST